MKAILWPARFGGWNVGVYQRMDFHPSVKHDIEWDSEHDTSKFHYAARRLKLEDARSFADSLASNAEELPRDSERIPGLERMLKSWHRNQ